ncbi:MAG: hypothetical protein ACRD6X_21530 [Pyrinomonadaceae bacterium]
MKPGEDIINQGVKDLSNGVETIPALLVLIGAPRLTRLGFDIPHSPIEAPEHRLYQLLSAENSDAAHSKYNALIRKLVSFERASECVK